MNKVEFYTFENEVWYRTLDGKNERLSDLVTGKNTNLLE